MRSIVIIGNGISGITAAREIRKHSADSITVISSETEHFFSRTALMYIYMGHMQYQHTKPYEDWFWAKNRIDLVHARVDRIDTGGRHLTLTDGRRIRYDVLVLALGSTPNEIGLPGHAGQQLTGVQGLYSLQDLEQMDTDTKGIRQAVVAGGGLIGIEMAEMLLSRGIQVTFLVRESSFWNHTLPEAESAMISQHIRDHTIDLRLSTELAELIDDGTGRISSVRTTRGDLIPAQFAGIAIGVRPQISLLRGTGIDTDRGILVNAFLETNVPDVYAIGDCVQHRTPPTGRKAVEQIWYTGRIMGETVAKTILGKRTAYQPGVFFNSAKFFDIEYQTYGLVPARLPADGSLQSLYWQHPEQAKALRIVFTGDDRRAVTGMHTFGIRQRQGIWEQWIQTGAPVQQVMAHIADTNFDPEFVQRHEPAIVSRFNEMFPEMAVSVPAAPKNWLSRLFS
ncbi:NAD(P)/FAD-dependent oxidoreductase [Arsenicibacter rosenii]|uniref:FAD-dependent oxidoreductase n=1 Tax=Arsenicibacter rosenii TaxID=1750698 RepID=A0A1S2VBF0_9BACT|nr:FAD-dependent oxidoreductase [Arsenicibacter rosenii]OIN56054.1 FAD-dependent oxidoreductase [Arsenicibacter rosenii]